MAAAAIGSNVKMRVGALKHEAKSATRITAAEKKA
jgi:hypothetical protein